MLDFENKPKLLLNESNHVYYYIKNNEKVWLNNYQSVSCLVSEWYYIKNNYNQEFLPFHWKKEFLYLHSENNYMATGTKIHKEIASGCLSDEFDWMRGWIPENIDGKFEYGMFLEDKKVSLVGSCDLINIENDKVVIYEFKNSFNPKTQKQLIEKGKMQLFLYGFLAYQTFTKELHYKTKIKLVLLIFEHFNKNVLKFEWNFDLTDIINQTKTLNSLWLNRRAELHQKKIEYRNNFSIEGLEELLKKYYKIKNDMCFMEMKKAEKDLETSIKKSIDLYREKNPDQKFFSAIINDKIMGFLAQDTYQLDKEKYIKVLKNELSQQLNWNDNNFNKIEKTCMKKVNRKYWKETE